MKSKYIAYQKLCFDYVKAMNMGLEKPIYGLVQRARGHPIRFYVMGEEVFRVPNWKRCYTALQQYDITVATGNPFL